MPRLALAIALSLIISACSSAGTDGVRPFSEIAEGDPRITFDPSGTAATLTISTTVDVACAVVYGKDGPAGGIATDQDMGGGAHADHQPVMTELQPETTYQYRLQGVAADGNLYRSEVFTFTTPAAAESAHGDNLAHGATIVDVSSEFSSAFAATNAVDGDVGTEWSTTGDGDDAFITIDLGAETAIAAVAFRTRSMGDGSSVTETFTIEAAGTTYGPFPAGDPVEVSLEARELTFQVDSSTGGNTGAVEIEVYGR